MTISKEYVVGFLFSEDMNQVILIKKKRPDWQNGKYNGVGGHIEENETPKEAMIREYEEEAGKRVEEWTHYVTLENTGWKVYFFFAVDNTAFLESETKTDEDIFRAISTNLPTNVIPNLRWLIPICCDNLQFPLHLIEKNV